MIPTRGIRLPGSLCIFLFDLSQETGTLRLRAKDDQDRLEGDIPADGFLILYRIIRYRDMISERPLIGESAGFTKQYQTLLFYYNESCCNICI